MQNTYINFCVRLTCREPSCKDEVTWVGVWGTRPKSATKCLTYFKATQRKKTSDHTYTKKNIAWSLMIIYLFQHQHCATLLLSTYVLATDCDLALHAIIGESMHFAGLYYFFCLLWHNVHICLTIWHMTVLQAMICESLPLQLYSWPKH